MLRPCNGRVRLTHSGKRAWYICSSGYTLLREAFRSCVYGIWLGSAPVCVKGKRQLKILTLNVKCFLSFMLLDCPVCPHLSSPANGDVRVFGNAATYSSSCNLGYRLRGNRRRICFNGVWSGHEPSCDRSEPTLHRYVEKDVLFAHFLFILVCPNLRGPGNGAVQVSGIVATYSCNSGYDLRGNRRRICSNGVWSGSEPSCERSEPMLHRHME